jgi:hypothetical protein
MTIPKTHVEIAQRILIAAGYPITADGIPGPRTASAAASYASKTPAGKMTPARWVALVLQVAANLSDKVPHKIAEDGYYGPTTADAAYRLAGETFARPDEPTIGFPGSPSVRCWTPSDAQMSRKFGQPGSGQIIVDLPYPMRLAWDLNTTVSRASMHAEFQKPLTSALETIRDYYGLDRIRELRLDLFGGILNVRKKRGGSTWSAHAWGTAIDLDPDRNRLAWKRDRASFARPEYRVMREAFTAAGLMSLGTCYDFDWMHFQLNP